MKNLPAIALALRKVFGFDRVTKAFSVYTFAKNWHQSFPNNQPVTENSSLLYLRVNHNRLMHQALIRNYRNAGKLTHLAGIGFSNIKNWLSL